ncbi:MAG: phage portal protein [Chelatococcus sp.]|nr:MAG: phage portal protein [Chelatococcus sp.]
MGIVDRLRSLFGSKDDRHAAAFAEQFWQSELGMGRPSLAGEHVSWRSALEVTTALRCGFVLSDGVSTVPCKIMHKDPATGRRREAADHPLYELFAYQVNDWMDWLQLRETLMLHTVFTGDGVAFVNRVRGRVVEIIPLVRGRVRIEQKDDYSLRYHVAGLDGLEQEFPASAILHIRGPSWNGWQGLDNTKLSREAIGLAMATQNAHARRFGNGIQTTGVYSVEGSLDEEGYKRLRAYIDKNHVGARNSGKPFILDRGAKWLAMDLSGVDAQHVETRRLQIEEICRGYGVNPIMVYHSDKASTYASAEQMFLSHAVHTIRPWHRRLEYAMRRQLLTRDEVRDGYYVKFFDTELLRGAAKDRAEFYWKMFQMGMSPNDIFALEDQDGFDGGELHFVPSTMMTVENAAKAERGSGNRGDGGPGFNVDDEADVDPGDDKPPASARRNAGRVLSAENEGKIRGARDNLDSVLSKLEEQQEP